MGKRTKPEEYKTFRDVLMRLSDAELLVVTHETMKSILDEVNHRAYIRQIQSAREK